MFLGKRVTSADTAVAVGVGVGEGVIVGVGVFVLVGVEDGVRDGRNVAVFVGWLVADCSLTAAGANSAWRQPIIDKSINGRSK